MHALFISWGLRHPRTLFLIDGLGAGVSALMLGVVWKRFLNFLGFPHTTLTLLAVIPCFFLIFDCLQYFGKKQPQASALKSIAMMNGAYCVLSLFCCFWHHNTLTTWGFLYLMMEVLIVLLLAYVEWEVGKQLPNATSTVETKR